MTSTLACSARGGPAPAVLALDLLGGGPPTLIAVARSCLLQDWITVDAEAGEVVQSSCGWLRLGDYTDLALYTSSQAVSPDVRMAFETAVSDDPDLVFASAHIVPVQADTQELTVVRFDRATAPPAAWLRWKLLLGSAGSATFRVWAALARTAR